MHGSVATKNGMYLQIFSKLKIKGAAYKGNSWKFKLLQINHLDAKGN